MSDDLFTFCVVVYPALAILGVACSEWQNVAKSKEEKAAWKLGVSASIFAAGVIHFWLLFRLSH